MNTAEKIRKELEQLIVDGSALLLSFDDKSREEVWEKDGQEFELVRGGFVR